MSRTRELLREPWVQRGVRAALAAALAWQVAVLLPPAMAQYAYYAPLGAVIAVHPTVADSAAAAWRTVLAILLGFGLAATVHEVTRPAPGRSDDRAHRGPGGRGRAVAACCASTPAG